MEFHEIDAQGPIKIERVATLPTYTTSASDMRRILYVEDEESLYYGTHEEWREASTSSLVNAHISASSAHDSDGDIVGMNTLTNYSLATTAARGFLDTLSGEENQYMNGLGNWKEVKTDGMKVTEISQTEHGFAVGDVVRLDGSNYVKAIASSSANAEVVGIVSEVTSNDVFVLTLGGYVDGLSGLVAGTPYFLSDTTSGGLTSIEPTGGGMVSKPLLIAPTATTGYFFNMRGSVVSAPSIRTYVDVRTTAVIENVTGLTTSAAPIPSYALKYVDYTIIADDNGDFQPVLCTLYDPPISAGCFVAPEAGKYLFTGGVTLLGCNTDHSLAIAQLAKNWDYDFAYSLDDPAWYTYEAQRQYTIGNEYPEGNYSAGIDWSYAHIVNMEAGDYVYLAVCVWGTSKVVDVGKTSIQVVRVF